MLTPSERINIIKELISLKQRTRENGIHPIHKKSDSSNITVLTYDEHAFKVKHVEKLEEYSQLKDTTNVTWINVEGANKSEILKSLGDYFNFHPLVIQDITNTDQRPKIENFGDYIFFICKMMTYDDKKNEIITEQVSIIIGTNYLISFQEGKENTIFNTVREGITSGKGRIKNMRPDYLAYALLDAIVENYFLLLDNIREQLECLEDAMVTDPKPEMLQSLHNLKRNIIFLHKSVWPLKEVIKGFEKVESLLIREATTIYLRGVYDNTIQILDTIGIFKDMLTSMLEVYVSSVSNKLNEIMKILTVITTIFMPLNLVTGFYGQNLKYLPFAEFDWGFFGIIFLMLIIAISMILYFKKKKWL
ncbi:MAG: magnesium/cobalt transporter CorA [Desulfobacterales bacterium]|nr:magnesium/cobalt transporter CorA [Desulfobacterales bacterium]